MIHAGKRRMDVEVRNQFEFDTYSGLSRVLALVSCVYIGNSHIKWFSILQLIIQYYLRRTKTSLSVSFLTVFTPIPRHSV